MSVKRNEIKPVKISDLIEEYQNGNIQVPEFQRAYVWKPNKAPKLLDSIYKEYSISVLIFWTSDAEVYAQRSKQDQGNINNISWLVDGQQRITTLYRIKADEGIDVMFNPVKEEFHLATKTLKKDPGWFRVYDIFDDKTYRRIRHDLPQGVVGERIEASFEKVRKILDREISTEYMRNHSYDEVLEAFYRINTLGMKLKTIDIENARIALKHVGFIATEIIPFIEKINKDGFTKITNTHLFRICDSIASPDGRNNAPLLALDRKQVTDAWAKTKRAINDALSIIKNEMGISDTDLLWKGTLLIPLVTYCAYTKSSERDVKGITAWMALSALHNRYNGSGDYALSEDIRATKSNDPIGNLLKNLDINTDTLFARASNFKGGFSNKGAIFCLYIACRHKGLIDVFNGSKITPQSSIEKHHIFSRVQLGKDHRYPQDVIANTVFIRGDQNISAKVYAKSLNLNRTKGEILNSQCIPTDKSLWDVECAQDFWNARRELIAESFNEYLKNNLSNRKLH